MARENFNLSFVLGTNQSTGAPQWKAEVVDGEVKIVYIPDVRSRLKPTNGSTHFACAIGKIITHSPRFKLIAVFLNEAIASEEETPYLGEVSTQEIKPVSISRPVRTSADKTRAESERRARQLARAAQHKKGPSNKMDPSGTGTSRKSLQKKRKRAARGGSQKQISA